MFTADSTGYSHDQVQTTAARSSLNGRPLPPGVIHTQKAFKYKNQKWNTNTHGKSTLWDRMSNLGAKQN